MLRMTQSALLTVVFTLVLVGSVGAVSATIDSVTLIESGSDGTEPDVFEPGPDTGGEVDASEGGESAAAVSNSIDLQFCIGFLRTLPAVGLILSTLGLATYGVKRQYNGSTAALVSAGVVPVVLFAYFVFTNCPGQGSGGDSVLSGSDVLGSTGTVGTAPSIPPVLLGVGAAGVVLLAVGALYVMTGSDESFDMVESDEEETFDVKPETIAQSAGHAADRIEESDVPVDNAVYRAWQEMTALLDMESSESTPPADFAERAVESGLDEAKVRELTDLFRDVRYGEKSATEREDRAVEVLRDIEQSHRELSESESDEPYEGRDDR